MSCFRRLCLLCALGCASLSAFEIDRIRFKQWSASIAVEYAIGDEFRVGNDKNEWDDSIRFQADIRYQLLPENRMDPFAGFYFYYDEREWFDIDNFSGLKMTSVGGGLQLGMLLKPTPGDRDTPIRLGLMPYVRVGFGTADVDLVAVGGVDNELLFREQQDPGYRVDTSIGLDLRVRFSRQIEVFTGFGFLYWQTANLNTTGFNEFGNDITSETLDFNGHEFFIRGGASYRF